MEIKQAQEKKTQLEYAIAGLLQEYSRETGMVITDVGLRASFTIGTHPDYFVKLEVRLPPF